LLNKHFGCARWLYNYGLHTKIESYENGGVSVSCIDIANRLPLLKQEFPWLKEVNSQSLQMALRHLDTAYQRFFREKKGFPRFKSKKDNRQRFSVPQHSRVDFAGGLLIIPKFKKGIRIRLHREFTGTIKTITITRTPSNKYYASILTETPETDPVKKPMSENKAIGIDLGISHFAILSTGEKIDNPRYLIQSQIRLKRLQRRLSRKQKGSSNRDKARLLLAAQHDKVFNQRNDFLQKTTSILLKEYDTLCLETLSPSNMVKNHCLARSINDVSWGSFNRILEYKARWQGKNILRLDRFQPSTKICSCGAINENLTLKDRIWTCHKCKEEHDRDILAARNILRYCFKKQYEIGQGLPESTLSEKAMPSVI
jgi:putative transposase